jgi:hypothetical protein
MVLVPRRRPLNHKIIASNVREAIEELQKLEGRAQDGTLREAQLQVGLLHAYHHLNVAWNVRRVSTSEYATLTDAQFKEWGTYPTDLENL